MRASIPRHSLRYVLVSLFCMALSNAILIGMDAANMHYLFGIIASAAVLIPVGFLLQACVTFMQPLNWSGFRRYALAMSANPPLSYLLLTLLHGMMGLAMLWAAPLVTILLFGGNYFTSGWAIGRSRPFQTSSDAQGALQ